MKKILLLIFCVTLVFACKPDNGGDNTDYKEKINPEGDDTEIIEETKEPHVVRINMFDNARYNWDNIYIKVNIYVSKTSPKAAINNWSADYEYYYEYEENIDMCINVAMIEIEDPVEYLGGTITIELYNNAEFFRFSTAGEYSPSLYPCPSLDVKKLYNPNNIFLGYYYEALSITEKKMITPADKSKPSYYRLKYSVRFEPLQ